MFHAHVICSWDLTDYFRDVALFVREDSRVMFRVSSTGKESSAGGDNKTVESGQRAEEGEAGRRSDVQPTPVAEVANGVVAGHPPDDDVEIADEAAEKLEALAV